jgi:predicted ArsR family transcriptional regulator
MPRTLAQEVLVILDEPSADRGPVTIGQLSRRLGVSSALTRLCARQLVADGQVEAVMVEHAGMTTIQGLSRIRPADPVPAPAPATP